jgi:hypothetical protein
MRRNSVALYRPQGDVGGCFCISSMGKLKRSEVNGVWQESSMSYAHRQAVQWVRLA